jgi:hypothetical protein
MTETTPVRRPPQRRIDAPLTPEIERVLGRYLEIQRTEKEIEAEKVSLQEALAAFLGQEPDGLWYPTVAGTPLKVRLARETAVEYNEPLLRQRLADRYVHVLRPDPKKIRQHLAEVEPLLAPLLTEIGSPDRDRVRTAIEQGLVRADEFAGAFRKSQRVRLAVMRSLAVDAGSAPPPDEV